MDISDGEIEPATGLRFAASVGRVYPVLAKDVPDFPLPLRGFDFGSRIAVVVTEIVIVVDRIDGSPCDQSSPFRSRLAAIVAVVLAEPELGLIDIDIVTQHQQGLGFEPGDVVPHPFPFRHVARTSPEGDVELRSDGGLWRSRKMRIGFECDEFAIDQHFVVMTLVRLETVDGHDRRQIALEGTFHGVAYLIPDPYRHRSRLGGPHPDRGSGIGHRSHHGSVQHLDAIAVELFPPGLPRLGLPQRREEITRPGHQSVEGEPGIQGRLSELHRLLDPVLFQGRHHPDEQRFRIRGIGLGQLLFHFLKVTCRDALGGVSLWIVLCLENARQEEGKENRNSC